MFPRLKHESSLFMKQLIILGDSLCNSGSFGEQWSTIDSYKQCSNGKLLRDIARVEVGPEIKITIVKPGFIESEMTQGKFLLKEGKMEVDKRLERLIRCVSLLNDLTLKNWSQTTPLHKLASSVLVASVQVSMIPVGTVRGCAKAIVNGACKGERYLTEPSWFRVMAHGSPISL
uniref:Uncharacterized protein n=1 Tax=Quercus lobata TaxID=97700 RepID=A0A7N2MNA4_QUELO